MGPLLEILFFALLSAYIFYRLWSVLGRETDEDRERRKRNYEQQEDDTADNAIPMPQRGQQSHLESFEDRLTPGIRDGIRQIRQVEPDFDAEAFVNGAKSAYEMIVQAFAEGDRVTLKALLVKSVYAQFDEAIAHREKEGLVNRTVMEGLERSDIDAIDVTDKEIRITVRFRSRQVMTSRNTEGQIVDNPAEISVPVTDVWTFTRDIGSKGPEWYLAATASGSYRD